MQFEETQQKQEMPFSKSQRMCALFLPLSLTLF